jgi:type 1 glutamine amidotransferase
MRFRSLSVLLLAGGFLFLLAAPPRATFFDVADADRDGSVSRNEFRKATAAWLAGNPADEARLKSALDPLFPETLLNTMLAGRGPQNQTPKPADVEKMMAALPSKAPAAPARERKVLVLSKCAGFVHSCIPLAAKTVEALGSKTGAWKTTVTYDSADINTANLKQYDALILNNTTGSFLDDPDPKVTAARKKALISFVRSGKGLVGIHAASDSYHEPGPGAPGMGEMLGPMILARADADKDKKLTAEELSRFSDAYFDRMDREKAGKIGVADLRGRFLFTLWGMPAERGAAAPPSGRPGRDHQVGTWPEFNKMIGGFFKYHWNDPTTIHYKIDDPDSPLTAMFRGPQQFSIVDETYTFGAQVWSRKNLRVLTSVDYAKMSDDDKRKEDYPREDHDYGLSWVRRDGKGRVFYEAHGHNERVYAIPQMLEHLLAGIQYAIGDVKANDAPSW